MQRRTFIKAASAATTLGISGLAGCTAPTDETGDGQGEETTTETATETPTPTPGDETTTGGGGGKAANLVRMLSEGSAFYFDPIGLYVEPGETVTWTITSGSHSSTAYDGRIPQEAEPWDSGILSEEGAEFTHTFEAPGTYDYFCTPHKSLGMVGRIVCGEPGGPAEGSQPPDGKVPSSQTIVEKGAVPFGPDYK